MNKKVKITLSVAGIIALGISSYFYVAFCGFPWKVAKTKTEAEKFIEEKYHIDVEVKEGFYNFKSGRYGAIVYPKGNPKQEFYVEESYIDGEEYLDNYPETVWEKQFEKDIFPLIEKLYPNRSEFFIQYPMGVSHGMEFKKGKIPYYREMSKTEAIPDLVIKVKGLLSEEQVKEEANKVFQIIDFLKKENITVIGVYVYFEGNGKYDETYQSFDIQQQEFANIKSAKDVEKFFYDSRKE